MSSFGGRMKEYERISLDRFDGKNGQSTVYFLSHLHEDHTAGLGEPLFYRRLKSNKNIFLYCSEVTEVLLCASRKYKHLAPFIKSIPINNPTTIDIPDPLYDELETVTVTLLPAFHCPGSVMCLFEGHEGNVIYTGDFRWEHFDIEQMHHLRSGERVKAIKSLYIDTTFCTPENLYIPSRQQCIDAVYHVVREWTEQGPDYAVYIHLRAQYGHEPLINSLAIRLNKKIHVGEHKKAVYDNIQEFQGSFTSDGTSTQLHACDKQCTVEIDGERVMCRNQYQEDKVLTILPTTMYFTQFQHLTLDKVIRRMSDNFYRACYSFHSSYIEIKDLLSYLKPTHVYPNVKPPGDEKIAVTQHRLNSMLKECKQSADEDDLETDDAKVKQLGTLKTQVKGRPSKRKQTISTSDSESLDFGTPSKKLKQKKGLKQKEEPATEPKTATRRSSRRLAASQENVEVQQTTPGKGRRGQNKSSSPDLFQTPVKSEKSDVSVHSSYAGSHHGSEIDLTQSLDSQSLESSKEEAPEFNWSLGSFLSAVNSNSLEDCSCVLVEEDLEQTDETFDDVPTIIEDVDNDKIEDTDMGTEKEDDLDTDIQKDEKIDEIDGGTDKKQKETKRRKGKASGRKSKMVKQAKTIGTENDGQSVDGVKQAKDLKVEEVVVMTDSLGKSEAESFTEKNDVRESSIVKETIDLQDTDLEKEEEPVVDILKQENDLKLEEENLDVADSMVKDDPEDSIVSVTAKDNVKELPVSVETQIVQVTDTEKEEESVFALKYEMDKKPEEDKFDINDSGGSFDPKDSGLTDNEQVSLKEQRETKVIINLTEDSEDEDLIDSLNSKQVIQTGIDTDIMSDKSVIDEGKRTADEVSREYDLALADCENEIIKEDNSEKKDSDIDSPISLVVLDELEDDRDILLEESNKQYKQIELSPSDGDKDFELFSFDSKEYDPLSSDRENIDIRSCYDLVDSDLYTATKSNEVDQVNQLSTYSKSKEQKLGTVDNTFLDTDRLRRGATGKESSASISDSQCKNINSEDTDCLQKTDQSLTNDSFSKEFGSDKDKSIDETSSSCKGANVKRDVTVKKIKFCRSRSFDMLDENVDNSEFGFVNQVDEKDLLDSSVYFGKLAYCFETPTGMENRDIGKKGSNSGNDISKKTLIVEEDVIDLTGDDDLIVSDNKDMKFDANVNFKNEGGKKLMTISFSKSAKKVKDTKHSKSIGHNAKHIDTKVFEECKTVDGNVGEVEKKYLETESHVRTVQIKRRNKKGEGSNVQANSSANIEIIDRNKGNAESSETAGAEEVSKGDEAEIHPILSAVSEEEKKDEETTKLEVTPGEESKEKANQPEVDTKKEKERAEIKRQAVGFLMETDSDTDSDSTQPPGSPTGSVLYDEYIELSSGDETSDIQKIPDKEESKENDDNKDRTNDPYDVSASEKGGSSHDYNDRDNIMITFVNKNFPKEQSSGRSRSSVTSGKNRRHQVNDNDQPSSYWGKKRTERSGWLSAKSRKYREKRKKEISSDEDYDFHRRSNKSRQKSSKRHLKKRREKSRERSNPPLDLFQRYRRNINVNIQPGKSQTETNPETYSTQGNPSQENESQTTTQASLSAGNSTYWHQYFGAPTPSMTGTTSGSVPSFSGSSVPPPFMPYPYGPMPPFGAPPPVGVPPPLNVPPLVGLPSTMSVPPPVGVPPPLPVAPPTGVPPVSSVSLHSLSTRSFTLNTTTTSFTKSTSSTTNTTHSTPSVSSSLTNDFSTSAVQKAAFALSSMPNPFNKDISELKSKIFEVTGLKNILQSVQASTSAQSQPQIAIPSQQQIAIPYQQQIAIEQPVISQDTTPSNINQEDLPALLKQLDSVKKMIEDCQAKKTETQNEANTDKPYGTDRQREYDTGHYDRYDDDYRRYDDRRGRRREQDRHYDRWEDERVRNALEEDYERYDDRYGQRRHLHTRSSYYDDLQPPLTTDPYYDEWSEYDNEGRQRDRYEADDYEYYGDSRYEYSPQAPHSRRPSHSDVNEGYFEPTLRRGHPRPLSFVGSRPPRGLLQSSVGPQRGRGFLPMPPRPQGQRLPPPHARSLQGRGRASPQVRHQGPTHSNPASTQNQTKTSQPPTVRMLSRSGKVSDTGQSLYVQSQGSYNSGSSDPAENETPVFLTGIHKYRHK